MRLSPLLPTRLRVGLDALRQGLTDLSRARIDSDRPVFRSMHTQAEIDALSEAARLAREANHSQARQVARRETVEARIRELTVTTIGRPTADAITLTFTNPADDPIRFTPGQFMTLLLTIDGEELRRAYSFMSDPTEDETVSITIKRVEGGRVSNWLCDNAQAGMQIRTLGPSGRFGTAPRPDEGRRVILIAGGSGITPLYAIAQALTAREPLSHIELYYGNRRRDDAIFHDELNALAAQRKGFTVEHVFEQAPEGFTGQVGRLSGAVFDAVVPTDAFAEYYICGPDAMMEGAISALTSKGVPEANIHMERFTASAHQQQRAATGAVYSLQFRRSGALLQTPDDQTLLEAGLAAGVPMAYSCTFGGCGACKVKLLSGEVEMEEPNCLTEAERRDGEVLACVARARSAVEIDL